MPHCTVRYHVRLVPSARDADAVNAIGIFDEEWAPDEFGNPGVRVSRRLAAFTGPAGPALREMVTRGNAWKMDIRYRAGPLAWDD